MFSFSFSYQGSLVGDPKTVKLTTSDPYGTDGCITFNKDPLGKGSKKNCEKAVRLTALGGEVGSPPLSLTTSICENFDPFLSFIKRQNNPKYGNLSRNFHIFLTASGEGRGGSTQAVSLTAFSQFFFEPFPNEHDQ